MDTHKKKHECLQWLLRRVVYHPSVINVGQFYETCLFFHEKRFLMDGGQDLTEFSRLPMAK